MINISGSAHEDMAAISRSLAIIRFKPDGTILSANQNFCEAMGYKEQEIVGQHHRIFVGAFAASPDYAAFWRDLAAGKVQRRQFKRYDKAGREVWIEASYNPVMRGGRAVRVVKVATVITEEKRVSLDNAGKISALSRSQAVIEFKPDGTIIGANPNFLAVMGYQEGEIVGRHHSMFCEPGYAASSDYRQLWERLRAGEFAAGEYARIGKDGRKVFIQASYNPILDDEGRVFKVVKFASDVTGRVEAVEAVTAGLDRLSRCDISVTIDKPFSAEFEQLRHNFNGSIGQFQTTLERVLAETGHLTGYSDELGGGANRLGERTAKQAASLEEAAAALGQITEAVKKTTERSNDTLKLVGEARSASGQSVDIVRQAIESINRIESASKEIGNIIDVIDQIAFQTNLLALNAGVEAARAGDAGKGFAVVAQEVRALAQRSAEAAQTIGQLIDNSSREVAHGVDFVSKTGAALERINAYVDSITENIDAITSGAREQSDNLTEVNSAIAELDQVTQQNATLVAEITHCGSDVQSGAATLAELVGRFRLNRRSEIRAPGSTAAGQQRTAA